MEMDNKEEFEEKIKETAELEKEIEQASDSRRLQDVLTGAQEIYVASFGTLQFEHPTPGLAIKGDSIVAAFKSKHLRLGDYLSIEELKFIYQAPIKVKSVDGQDVVVGDGIWTEKQEKELEDLPVDIQQLTEMFDSYRKDIQDSDKKIKRLGKDKKNNTKRNQLENVRQNAYDKAFSLFDTIIDKKKKHLELQTKKIELFSLSLEEQAFFEKIKLYLPECVKHKKDGKWEQVWNNLGEVENSENRLGTLRVISLYSLFCRGVDVSFFGDVVDGQT
jgi:hypothetical protein